MRFLFISHSFPEPPTNGGNQRTALLLRALRELGHVDLLLMYGGDAPDPAVLHHLRSTYDVVRCVPLPRRGERGGWRYVRPMGPHLVDRLAHHLGNDAATYAPHPSVASVFRQTIREQTYDLIVGRYLRPTAFSGALAHPVLLDVDDIDYEVLRWKLEDPSTPGWSRPIIRRHYRSLKRLVPRLLSRCAHLWVSNASDQDALEAFPTTVLPNIPFVEEGRNAPAPLPPSDRRTILTVASFLQHRNVAGVDYFVRDVWPAVHRQAPDAVFEIVGSHLAPAVERRWAAVPGVRVRGFVEDLQDAYRASAFTVAPLFYGGGTNIKVLESLAYGRACLVTPFVHRGFAAQLQHGRDVHVADGAEALGTACLRLLDDSAYRASLGLQGARAVRDHFSYERFRDAVWHGVEAALETAHAGTSNGAVHLVHPTG